MDIITYLSFGKSVDAIHAPEFKAPILVAMDASMPVFVAFKHFSFYKNMIINCPPKLSKILSPPTAGLVDLQQVCYAVICYTSDYSQPIVTWTTDRGALIRPIQNQASATQQHDLPLSSRSASIQKWRRTRGRQSLRGVTSSDVCRCGHCR